MHAMQWVQLLPQTGRPFSSVTLFRGHSCSHLPQPLHRSVEINPFAFIISEYMIGLIIFDMTALPRAYFGRAFPSRISSAVFIISDSACARILSLTSLGLVPPMAIYPWGIIIELKPLKVKFFSLHSLSA